MAESSASVSKPVRVLTLALALTLSGCDRLPPQVQGLLNRIKGSKSAAPAPSGTPVAQPTKLSSEAARRAKVNAELLKEMFLVVFVREPKSRAEFGSLVDTLNQGASLEGLYNGFTHSSDYRVLENENRGASPGALKAFGEELAILAAELPSPTEFTQSDTLPLALPVNPADAPPPEGKVDVVVFDSTRPQNTPTAQKPKIDLRELADKYSRGFVGSSIYTLKRVLGDEALKVMATKKDFPEQLAQWYSKWAVRIAGRNIDFGLALRNKPDVSFHYNWAVKANEDQIRWEVLNRLHRVLNETNRVR